MSRVAALWPAHRLGPRRASSAGSPPPVTFPATRLVSRVQLALAYDPAIPPNEWGWVDVTPYVRQDLGISLTVGRRDEASTVTTGSATMKLDNRDGRFTRRNPNSPYYGLLSKNTPIWVTVDAGSGEKTRIEMFVNEWPTRWSDKSASDSTVTIRCAGILRRLGQGQPLKSPLQRSVPTFTAPGTMLGYWGLENVGGELTSAPSSLAGGAVLPIIDSGSNNQNVTRDLDGSLAGSWPVPRVTLGTGATVGASNFGGVDPATTVLLPSTGDSWSVAWWTRSSLRRDQNSDNTITATVKISGSPQVDTWFFVVRQTTSGGTSDVRVSAFAIDSAGNLVPAVGDIALTGLTYVDRWRWFRANIDLDGSSHRMRLYLDEVLLSSTTVAGYTPGQPSAFRAQCQVTNSQVPLSIGHIAFSGGTGGDILDTTNSGTLFWAGTGYVGEQAHVRIERLCREEGVPFTPS